MNIKIHNDLSSDDFTELASLLRQKTVDAIVILNQINLGFVAVEPLVISVSDFFYSIDVEVYFEDSIGFEAWAHKNIENRQLVLSRNGTEWHIKKTIDEKEIEDDINYALQLIEGVLNYACSYRGVNTDESFTVNSRNIRRLINQFAADEERRMRGEKIQPFGTLHAKSARSAKDLGGDLLPIYITYDRWDLFGAKKVYRYLPKGLVRKLLICDRDHMICEDEFNENEKVILDDLVGRKYLRKKKIFGKNHYYDLNEKTRRHFISMFS
jgi:hypothetical protein